MAIAYLPNFLLNTCCNIGLARHVEKSIAVSYADSSREYDSSQQLGVVF